LYGTLITRLKAFRQATQNSLIGLLSLSDHRSHPYILEQKALNNFILVTKPSFLKKAQNIYLLALQMNYA